MEPASAPTRFRGLLLWLALAALALAAYFPALRGEMLWDDAGHVTPPELRPPDGLRRIWFEPGASQQYYPLLHTAFWLEHRLWGDAPTPYHVLNVLLHATAAFLVVTLARRLALPGAVWAGFLFAVHPVAVESVAWISEQKNTLSAVFYLAAALAYLDFDLDRRPARYALASVLFGLALASKTVTATLPAALLVVCWWRRGRLDWRRDLLPLLPWLVLGVAAGLFTAWVERRFVIGDAGTGDPLTLLQRGLLAGRVLWFYLGKLFWPVDLAFIYPRWTIDAAEGGQWLFPLAALGLLAALVAIARRRRGPLAGFLFFAGTLFPALGFFDVYPFRYSYVADHFQYLASLGVIVAVTSGVAAFAARHPRWRAGCAAAATVVIAVAAGLTWRQSRIYREARTLYLDTLEKNPGCSMAHNNLGELLVGQPGRLEEAYAHYAAAVRLDPRNPEARNNLGYALARMPGREAEAAAEYEAALRLNPRFAEAHNNLGLLLGGRAEAIDHFARAVQLKPGVAGMRDNLGVALSAQPGRLAEATEQFAAAVRLAPDLAALRDHLGSAYARQPGREADAVAQFEAAVRLAPASAELRFKLAAALLKIPARAGEAAAELEAAVRARPDFFEAHFVLGLWLAGQPGRQAEALGHFEAAARLRPDFAPAREWIARLRPVP